MSILSLFELAMAAAHVLTPANVVEAVDQVDDLIAKDGVRDGGGLVDKRAPFSNARRTACG